MALDTKYRPIVFDDVLGQESTVKVLRSLLERGEVFHRSYIFSGPSGTGKTTTARILARAMLCKNLTPSFDPCNECPSCLDILNKGGSHSFKEMDAANNSGKENISRIVSDLNYYTIGGGDRKIYLIDESHRLSSAAKDALLKPMEDNVVGNADKKLVCIFCTTEPENMPPAIKSRCMTFTIKDPTREEITDRLKLICSKEGISYENEALDLIFNHGRGHIRDMVTALERVSGLGEVTAASVSDQLGLNTLTHYYDIILNLKDAFPESLKTLDHLLTMTDPSGILEGIVEACLASYRVSHNISIGMNAVDKEKASEVFQKYGEDVLHIANRIMSSSRKVNRNSLLCDVAILSKYLRSGNIDPTTSVLISKVEHVQTSSAGASNNMVSTQETKNDLTPSAERETSCSIESFKEQAKGLYKSASMYVNPSGPITSRRDSEDKMANSPKTTKADIKPASTRDYQDFWSN